MSLKTIGYWCLIFLFYLTYLIKNAVALSASICLALYLLFTTLTAYTIGWLLTETQYLLLLKASAITLSILVYLYPALVISHCLSLLLSLATLAMFPPSN